MEERIQYIESSRPTWLQRKYRRLVHDSLSKLTDCQLELQEPGETLTFGTQSTVPGQALFARIKVHDISAYQDFCQGGDIGAAEAYIQQKWDSDDLTRVIQVFARAQQKFESLQERSTLKNAFLQKMRYLLQRNSLKGSRSNILAHYDLGNALFSQFLDPTMMYSSALFSDPEQSLENAQLNKLNSICEKLSLKPDDHLLEIGSGWGGMALFAARHYGCQVTTTTISDAQYEYAKQKINEAGLDDRITLLKKDYRDLSGHYDKIVSIEMIEAVGYQYLDTFFSKCDSLLKPGGSMLLQAITIADQRMQYYRNHVDFIQRYIFPGGFLPSVSLMTDKIANHTQMLTEQLSDMGQDYAQTIHHWRHRFLAAWPSLSVQGYDETFKRLWLYYLCYCEGAFLERNISTVHLVARKSQW